MVTACVVVGAVVGRGARLDGGGGESGRGRRCCGRRGANLTVKTLVLYNIDRQLKNKNICNRIFVVVGGGFCLFCLVGRPGIRVHI